MLGNVLAGEFRSDLNCAPTGGPRRRSGTKTKDEETAVGEFARRLRANFSEVYSEMADRVEADSVFATPNTPDALGSIDTFRFEERTLLAHAVISSQ